MKTCAAHRHEHRQLPCPWPDCENSEGAGDVVEVQRHSGAGAMTPTEGRFEVAPAPRVFHREQWTCETCAKSGWAWVEAGAAQRPDRCPHRRTRTVVPIERR
jgi:hypothetical protein